MEQSGCDVPLMVANVVLLSSKQIVDNNIMLPNYYLQIENKAGISEALLT